MATCVVLDSQNQVVNYIIADPSIEPPEGCTLVEIPDGFYWDGSAVVEVINNGN